MKKILLVSGLVVAVALAGIQFIRPNRENPASDPAFSITAHVNVPGDVRAVLERSCYDCHSNQTRWPWYSAVAPVSWLVARDVEEGRKEMNFSEWGKYPRKRQSAKLEMIVTEVDKEEMPLGIYLLMHRDASLSEDERDLLCAWAEGASDSLGSLGSR